jgi:hypothetical protein
MSQVDLVNMITVVFSQPPGQQGSYKLDLSVDSQDIENDPEFPNALAKTTANVLMEIFIYGSKILFGNDITPAKISDDQFLIVNKYINSFGYQTHYEYTYKDETNIPSGLDVYFTSLDTN